MTDIVERLRTFSAAIIKKNILGNEDEARMAREAADEIERLRKRAFSAEAAFRALEDANDKARSDALEEAAKLVDAANAVGSWAYGDDIRALKETT